jgi:hypothetical protein
VGSAGLTYTFRFADGGVFRLAPGRSALIGRTPEADLYYDGNAMARRHARLVNDGGACSIEVLNAFGPIRVNQREIGRDAGTPLNEGDTIDLLADSLRLTVGVEPTDGPVVA